jgi:beta-galactosidase/beta-glucuronidase
MRPQRSLAGSWEFQIDPDDLISIDSLAPDRTIPVPMPWQAVFPELQTYSGFAWYRRAFDLPEDWLAGELLLHFGAVDYWCRVFVNG